MSSQDLRDAAFVTDAARGLGAAYAERLAQRGRDLILVGRDGAALKRMAGRLSARGVRIELVVADLGSDDDIAAVETQLRGDDRITVLINDADPGEDSKPSRTRRPCETAMRLARAAAEGFVAQRHGTILNVAWADESAKGPALPAQGLICVPLVRFSRALREELRPHGVHVKARLHSQAPRIPHGARTALA